jgi:hypothetical protein
MQWFRMYAEFATDPVVQSMSFDDQRHFVIILCLKCSGALDRQFGDAHTRAAMLRRALGLEALAFDEAKNRLCASGLIDSSWQPKNWEKRQFLTDHSAAERMKRYRQRHRDVTVTSPVTKSDVLDSESDTDSEAEKNQEGEARAPRSARATRLPEDFTLTPERRAVAEIEKSDPDREFQNFTDYWLSASGAKSRKHDWDRTWRMWCRRAADFKPKGHSSAPAPKRTGAWRLAVED